MFLNKLIIYRSRRWLSFLVGFHRNNASMIDGIDIGEWAWGLIHKLTCLFLCSIFVTDFLSVAREEHIGRFDPSFRGVAV
jgi:hypothetical protein